VAAKHFEIWLTLEAYIAVDFVTAKGRVVSFVVRLMWVENEQQINVARYDTAHGSPHRDILGEGNKLIQKEWFFDLPADRVLKNAIEDFRLNHEHYIAAYKRG
jgi:hypothetical protein